jgi:hypothetical protein
MNHQEHIKGGIIDMNCEQCRGFYAWMKKHGRISEGE